MRASQLLVLAMIFGMAAACERSMPAPSVAKAATTVEDVQVCAPCHAEIVVESRESLHGRARSDPSYVTALAREADKGFCERCHDPAGGGEHGAGVSCADCHAIFHQRVRAVVRSERCAPCHEFRFPERTDAMQLTFTEHAISPHPDTACAECHMRATPTSRRNHAFAASREPAMLARAATITGQQGANGVITLRLTQNEIGHAFPTGDLFRRLRVVVERLSQQGERVDFAEAIVGRSYGVDHGKKVQVADNRPGSPANQGGRETVLTFPLSRGSEHAGSVVRYRVSYERVGEAFADSALVEESTLVVEGTVP